MLIYAMHAMRPIVIISCYSIHCYLKAALLLPLANKIENIDRGQVDVSKGRLLYMNE